jgi:hypothetical protein
MTGQYCLPARPSAPVAGRLASRPAVAGRARRSDIRGLVACRLRPPGHVVPYLGGGWILEAYGNRLLVRIDFLEAALNLAVLSRYAELSERLPPHPLPPSRTPPS